MAILHGIVIDDPLAKEKLAFLADYFSYAARHRGSLDLIPVENQLSLVEKVIYQIENNPDHFHHYVFLYLEHPLLQEDNRLLKELESFDKIIPLIKEYLKEKNNQKKWVSDHPEFLAGLKSLAVEIDNKMFASVVDNIVKMIKCNCSLDKHKSDFIELVNCLVSEYAFRDISVKEQDHLFATLLNADENKFPLPSELVLDPTERKTYLEKLSTEDKLRGLLNLLKRAPQENHFIFKLSNFKTPREFFFKYDNVTFYGPDHPTIALIRKESEAKNIFFDSEVQLLAVAHASYQSLENQTKISLQKVRRATQFINTWLNINCTVNPYTYLLSKDLSEISGFSSDWKDDGYEFHDRDLERLMDNPYEFLKDYKEQSKGKLLFYEPLFLDALANRNPAIFWQYLEAIIPLTSSRDKQIKTVVPSLLLLNAEQYYRNRLTEYIRSAFHPFSGNSKLLGITAHQQLDLWKQKRDDLPSLMSGIQHPFLNYLMDERGHTITSSELIVRKEHYLRVISEAYAQRNFAVHSGLEHIKSQVHLRETLTRLVVRLRWVLFDGISQYDGLPFDEIVMKLYSDSISLLEADSDS